MRHFENWLTAYLEWTGNLESPALFHQWLGIGAVAVAMGRNAWINRGAYQLYPNEYIILLASSADCRKSTAIDQALKLVRNVEGTNIRSGKITTAALYKVMADAALANDGVGELLITADELSVLFTKDEATSTLISTLTEGYSGNKPLVKETKTAGTDTIPRPCLNLWAATTPSDLHDIFPEKATGMGFSPRCIIIHQEEPRTKNPWPFMDQNIQQHLIEDLQKIRELKGEFTIEPAAREWWNEWYMNKKSSEAENIIGAYHARQHDHVLKLVMPLSVSKRQELRATKMEMMEAVDLLDKVEPHIRAAYAEIGRTKETIHFDRILKQIRRKGGTATRRDLMQSNWYCLDNAGLMRVMESLVAAGRVMPPEIVPSKKGPIYKWALTKKEEEDVGEKENGGRHGG